jgi:predicted dehydrogenase
MAGAPSIAIPAQAGIQFQSQNPRTTNPVLCRGEQSVMVPSEICICVRFHPEEYNPMAEESKPSPDFQRGRALDRREFMTRTGAAVISFSIMRPELVRGSQANSKIALGMIGCGSRGTWIADLFQKHGGYEIVAAMDYFPDKVNAFGTKYNVPAERCYSGLLGYRRMLERKVDAVAIESPPYFHPEQAAAAVEAGAHVYLAKPVAVDVPGCRSIEESSSKASAKNRCFLVDFQTRTDPFYQEAIKRVHNGDIGPILCGEAAYWAGSPFTRLIEQLKVDPADPERRLRAWGVDRALSGDIITEQNIHAIDVACWIMDNHPVRAMGKGGLKSRSEGNCWDHFSVIFTFLEGVIVSFASKQFGKGYDDIVCRMYGAKGTIDTHYAGSVAIRGEVPYEGGKSEELYKEGAASNIATFYDDVTQGRFSNPTTAPSVRSNLTTILGRTAAYKHAEVTWEQLMKSKERLNPKLHGLKE